MFDIGWSELLVIGVVALIVVGPKDLPVMFRTLGRLTGKAKAMAREFSRAMEDAADQAGIAETTKELKGMTSKKALGLDALERATDKFEKWQPSMPKKAEKVEKTSAPVAQPDPNLESPDSASTASDVAPHEIEDEPDLPVTVSEAEAPEPVTRAASADEKRKETP
ncbi:Sec-independent protein translocase protein TatB [Thioclava kandeliae]|uniref:Sec-independent protein translocase protein TatB n=1 Tax=Thioclava kandeliae TaxID=3070818 RepID=A0ABV1SI29_9RHOB